MRPWDPPRDQAEVIEARFFDELSLAEIAQRTGRPVGTIGEAALAAIAAEVLARKDYGLPKYERLIVNASKRSESSKEYLLDWDEETITEYTRRWDEFQVATIEQHGDRHEIWFNTMIYYHEGPTTVIKGKWLMGPRHMSSPIAAANIGK